MHEDIIKTSSKLFIDGYYRQAVLDATIGLVNRVKQKSQCYELDNTPLMQNVFSPNKPILKISKSKDIQQGIMWLFSGAIMAFRNAHAHKLNCQITKKWISWTASFYKLFTQNTWQIKIKSNIMMVCRYTQGTFSTKISVSPVF